MKMRIEDFIRQRHGEKKMPQNTEVILNDLSVLRELVDDFYSFVYDHCTRGKIVSDMYMTIDEQINLLVDDVKGE